MLTEAFNLGGRYVPLTPVVVVRKCGDDGDYFMDHLPQADDKK